VVDDGSGVDPASVKIYVANVIAWQNRNQQPGFSVDESEVDKGYRYVIQPDTPFGYSQTIVVRVEAEDW